MTRLAALIACLALAPSAAPAGCPAGGCPTGASSYRVERTYATAYVAPTPVYVYPAPQAYAPAYAGKSAYYSRETYTAKSYAVEAKPFRQGPFAKMKARKAAKRGC